MESFAREMTPLVKSMDMYLKVYGAVANHTNCGERLVGFEVCPAIYYLYGLWHVTEALYSSVFTAVKLKHICAVRSK